MRRVLSPVGVALVLALAAVAAPLAGEAQPAVKVQRIGFLGPRSALETLPFLEAFRQGLSELGWAEGRNIVIEYRFAEGKDSRLPDLAAELAQVRADVIVAAGTAGTAAAKTATGTIPIVAVSIADPVGSGLVASIARPGGNVTGLSYSVGTETVGKGLELLKQTVPKIRRTAIIASPANPSRSEVVRDLEIVGRSLGVRLQFLEVRGPNDFSGAFAAMAKDHVEALLVVADAMFLLHRTRLAELAARSRLPAAYGWREHVEAGGLMSYGPSLHNLFRRSATFVDRILRGAKPGDLPIEQPTKFEFVINLKTAKASASRSHRRCWRGRTRS